MNPGAGNQYFPYEMGQQYPQCPPGWIYPLPSTYNFNDRGTPSPSPSTASSGSLSESFPFVEDGSMPESSQTSSRRTSSENKKARERWTKDEEKLLVQLWAEKHDLLESRECRKTWAWIAGNCVTLTAWCDVLFTDFVLKCDCSFPDKFFVTGRFQVRFVLDKSEIVL